MNDGYKVGPVLMNQEWPYGIFDWSDTFDDMDSGDWAEFYASSEPDDDVLEKLYEQELEREQELLEKEIEEEDEYRFEEIFATATLEDLAKHNCSIEAECLKCRHCAILNPKYLLGKVKSVENIYTIEARLRCQECGARNAIAYFDPEALDWKDW